VILKKILKKSGEFVPLSPSNILYIEVVKIFDILADCYMVPQKNTVSGDFFFLNK